MKIINSFLLCILLSVELVALSISDIPGGVPNSNSELEILEFSGYISAFERDTRNPAWVAYHLEGPARYQSGERLGRFLDTPGIKGEPQHEDYTNSGYDRGHLASHNTIGLYYGRDAQVETYYMVNIVPQSPALNRHGAWRELERLEPTLGRSFGSVWVFAGPIETSKTNRLQSGVSLPEGSFKIFVDFDEANQVFRTQAFIFEQNGKGDLFQRKCSVDLVERYTGLNFFPNFAFENEESKNRNIWIKENPVERAYAPKRNQIDTRKASSNSTSNNSIGSNDNVTKYWITSTGKTHRMGCRYYGTTKSGRYSTKASGSNCGICGGSK